MLISLQNKNIYVNINYYLFLFIINYLSLIILFINYYTSGMNIFSFKNEIRE